MSVCYEEIVYLSVRGISAKLIQKCVRFYLSANKGDQEKITNLFGKIFSLMGLEHFMYWRDKNLSTIGNEAGRWAVDYLIVKSMEGLIQDLGMDRKKYDILFASS
jgi:hypothetical protein